VLVIMPDPVCSTYPSAKTPLSHKLIVATSSSCWFMYYF
jgi:hypothetical protein